MWLTIPEASERIGKASSTVRRWAQRGKLDVRVESRDGRDVRLVDVSAAAALAGVTLPQDGDTTPAPPEARQRDDHEMRLRAALDDVAGLRAALADKERDAAVAHARLDAANQRIADLTQRVADLELRLSDATNERRALMVQAMESGKAHAVLASQVESYRLLSAWSRFWTPPPEARLLAGPTPDEPLEGG